jgi:Toprim domain
MIDIRAIARAMGGAVAGRNSVSCPGPGHSPRDRSLSVTFGAGGDFVVFSHAGDAWDVCKDYVRERLGWPEWQPGDGCDRRVDPSRVRAFDRVVLEAESEQREFTADDRERINKARAIWDNAIDPRGTAAETYLKSRALTLGDDVASSVLRFHRSCPWRDEDNGATVRIPALIAAFTSVDDNTVTAIHRIRLDKPECWPKAERRMLGVVHRAAVKLDPASDTICIGEGIETCLAARILGHAPAWALGSAGAIARLPVLFGVQCLRILGETDQTNLNATRLCGNRWHRAGRRVQTVMPSIGKDLNDELVAATA